MAQQIYLGPDYRGLIRFTTYNNIPAGLQPVVAGSADVQLLLVPLASSAIVQAAVSQLGTPENAAYNRLASAPAPTRPSNSDPSPAGSIYDKPNPSKQMKTDGSVVNPADGINSDGSVNVRVVAGGGSGGTVTVGAALPAGANKIGAVDATIAGAIPAGANKIGVVDAVLTGSNMELYGKSTDTKPTTGVKVGTTFFAIDTKTVYMWDGTTWVVI